MAMQKQRLKSKEVLQSEEYILVVKRSSLFPQTAWEGISKSSDDLHSDLFVQTILAKKEFLPRALMEHDPSYKQIIPYLVFNYKDKYFLMRRKSKASETRLRNKYSLGIGGHIRQEDIQDDDIYTWAKREFHEEVSYNGNLNVEFIGILNDDSTDVGKVHVGFVYLLQGDSSAIAVKEELESGQLYTLSECAQYYEYMESWSKFVFDFLQKK